jgi:hypothetical protein
MLLAPAPPIIGQAPTWEPRVRLPGVGGGGGLGERLPDVNDVWERIIVHGRHRLTRRRRHMHESRTRETHAIPLTSPISQGRAGGAPCGRGGTPDQGHHRGCLPVACRRLVRWRGSLPASPLSLSAKVFVGLPASRLSPPGLQFLACPLRQRRL